MANIIGKIILHLLLLRISHVPIKRLLLLLISELQSILTIKTIKIMKSVKVIFISAEIAALIGVIMFVFLTDWTLVEETGDAILYKIMIVLLSLTAVAFEREQEQIEWNEDE